MAVASVLLVAAAPASAIRPPRGAVTGTSAFNAVACPTGARCIAVGSDAQGDGSAAVVDVGNSAGTAGPVTLPAQTLFGVACAVPSDCVAISEEQIARVNVANAAMTETAKINAPAGQIVSMGRIACPNPTECFAVGFIGTPLHGRALVVRTSATGALLGTLQESSKSGIGAIACPMATTCLLAAANLAHPEAIQLLVNGHFGAQKVLAAGLYVQQLACFRTVACYALLGHRATTSERTNLLDQIDPANGAVMASHTIGGAFSADGIACAMATQCIVSGFAGTAPRIVVVTNGRPGAPRPVAGTGISAVGCTDTAVCIGVGQNSVGGYVQRV